MYQNFTLSSGEKDMSTFRGMLVFYRLYLAVAKETFILLGVAVSSTFVDWKPLLTKQLGQHLAA
jgi:hypothetical protein